MINDYGFAQPISSDLVAFNHLGLHRAGLRDRGSISGTQASGVGPAPGGGFSGPRPAAFHGGRLGRGGRVDARAVPPDVRLGGARLPLAFAGSVALQSSGRRRVEPGRGRPGRADALRDRPAARALIGLTRWSLDHGTPGRVVQAVVLPYATWATLLAALGLGSTRGPRVAGSRGRLSIKEPLRFCKRPGAPQVGRATPPRGPIRRPEHRLPPPADVGRGWHRVGKRFMLG